MSGMQNAKADTPNQVMAAYEILLEELEDEIEAVNRDGATALSGGNHAAVALLVDL
jgi:hypothetical protein